MNPEELEFLQQREKAIQESSIALQGTALNQAQQGLMLDDRNKSMMEGQLDLTEELDRIENLLRGRILRKDEKGNDYWAEPEDQDMIILSEYGIHLFMNTISFYINKDTLLSNYDEETIYKKMEDFSEALADTVFMEYEKVFHYPSLEDCKKVLNQRLENRKALKKYTYELLGKEYNEKEASKEVLDAMEGLIEKELEKIKTQLIKNKLKRFLILLRATQDLVHSTYLRALAGGERRTIRQHIHTSENVGQPQQVPPKISAAKWLR